MWWGRCLHSFFPDASPEESPLTPASFILTASGFLVTNFLSPTVRLGYFCRSALLHESSSGKTGKHCPLWEGQISSVHFSFIPASTPCGISWAYISIKWKCSCTWEWMKMKSRQGWGGERENGEKWSFNNKTIFAKAKSLLMWNLKLRKPVNMKPIFYNTTQEPKYLPVFFTL